ncbi:uncharacterized protein METZ01_LOCUS103818 [marine metagenome]|uniref:Uncharacterized protein n=1 Tax=marine metagenome TaxID=408172 RepID=A0A381WES1_9ZZZZ
MSTQCQFTVKRFRVDSISRFAVRCRSVAAAKHTQMNTKAREGQPSAANAVVQSASLIIRD